jgi:uncharacterized membrane protein YphA (DoxX/SURF4 family)
VVPNGRNGRLFGVGQRRDEERDHKRVELGHGVGLLEQPELRSLKSSTEAALKGPWPSLYSRKLSKPPHRVEGSPLPSRNLLRAFVLLWWTVGVVLLVGSLQTLQESLGPKHHSPVALLAGVEAVSALLFLIPKTLRLGATGLLLTLAVAFTVHLFLRQFHWDLLLYAAAVLFVAIRGALPKAQWKEAALHG